MAEAVSFTVPGLPFAWQRARSQGTRRFNSDEMESFRAKVVLFATQAGVTILDGPLHLRVTAWFPWPKGRHRKTSPRGAALMGCGKDWDNLGKMVSDALNGIAYHDDSQIAHGEVVKMRAAQGDPARTEVEIREMP